MTRKESNLEYVLTRSEEWAKNADVKIGVILGFNSVFLLALSSTAVHGTASLSNSLVLRMSYLSVLILLSWSILKALWGILPRLKHKQGKNSLLFYYDIQSMTLSEYKKQLKGMTATQYENELIEQNYALARIVKKKMICFRDSIVLLVFSLTLMGVLELWQHLMT